MGHDVTNADISKAIRSVGLSAQPVCLHSSLRSFGHVAGGASAVVEAFLAEQCTVMVPTFSYHFAIMPPSDMRPARNAWQYDSGWVGQTEGIGRIYAPECEEVHESMGAIPKSLLAMPERIRGDHPTMSFTAVGPLASVLIAAQQPLDAYAPLDALVRQGGTVLLIGVGLNRLTLLHYAEKLAGRVPFRRWANGSDGQPMMVEFGGCGSGFGNLEQTLSPVIRRIHVGQSAWMVLPAQEAVTLAAKAITANPQITHCGDPTCERCRDAVLGGPVLRSD